jgi:hypothetical protein
MYAFARVGAAIAFLSREHDKKLFGHEPHERKIEKVQKSLGVKDKAKSRGAIVNPSQNILFYI